MLVGFKSDHNSLVRTPNGDVTVYQHTLKITSTSLQQREKPRLPVKLPVNDTDVSYTYLQFLHGSRLTR